MTSRCTERNAAKLYREAAAEALQGRAFYFLKTNDRALLAEAWKGARWMEHGIGGDAYECRCLALCFMAAMVEAGDA